MVRRRGGERGEEGDGEEGRELQTDFDFPNFILGIVNLGGGGGVEKPREWWVIVNHRGEL